MLDITEIPIEKVIPYARNPRNNAEAVASVAASLREYGFRQPIVVDCEMTVVAGHTRLQAARLLGLESVPVHIAEGLTPAQVAAYRIADNRTAENAEWDMDLLRLELVDLDGDIDLSLTGFSEEEIASILAEATEGNTDEDDVPDPPAEPITVAGDVWVLGSHRLVCGNSTDADTVANCLNGVQPHLMVTDPPYGVDYDPDWRNRADRANGKPYGARAIGTVENDKNADWREAWVLFPGDVAYVWHAGIYAGIVHESLEASGFNIRSQIIWAKSRFAISRGDYHWQHEPCWYAVRKNKTGHWAGDRSQSTLWEITHNKSDTGHGTQKPVECMRRPMENNSSPGQAVYEPFNGSGTTIIAAETIGRVCYAIELNPEYVDIAIKRWQDFTGKKAVHAETGKEWGDDG